jgi:hypothetical protein
VPGGGRRISVDEFGPLNLLPRAGQCLSGPGKRVERHLLAAYDLESDKLMGRFYGRETWVQFLDFLKWLRRRYGGGRRCTWCWTTTGRT